jgi:hypothetical protein
VLNKFCESPKAKSLTNYLAIKDVSDLLLYSIPVIRVCCGGTGNKRGHI